MADPSADHLTIARLADVIGTGSASISGVDDAGVAVDVTRTAINSSRVVPGSLFVGLPGRRHDGSEFVAEAFANGAVCAIVGEAHAGWAAGPTIAVPDSLAALHRLAAWRREQIGVPMVAVAGSLGKTTVKDALADFLAPELDVYASPGSYNSQIGVPLCLLRCPADVDLGIIEMATTQPGEMATLAELVRPTYAIVTNVLERQRAHFGSADEHRAELFAIGSELPDEGWMLVGAIDGPRPESATSRVIDAAARSRVEPLGDLGYRVMIDDAHFDVLGVPRERATSVGLAGVAALELGVSSLPESYRPAEATTELWYLPGRATVVRFPLVADPMIWGEQLDRARSMAAGRGRLTVAVADPLDGVSAETLRAAFGGGDPAIEVLAIDRAASRFAAAGIDATAFTGRELADELRHRERVDPAIAVFDSGTRDLGAMAGDLLEAMSPARLYVSADAIRSNVDRIRSHLRDRVDVIAVIKGGGYGANPTAMADLLERAGVPAFAVATVDEGIDLRLAGLREPVLVLLPSPAELTKAARHDLAVAAQSDAIVDAALALGTSSPAVHLDVDTGMRRTGLPLDGLQQRVKDLHHAGVSITGIMTHLASADDPSFDDFTRAQLDRFAEACRLVEQVGVGGLARHALNTPGALRFGDVPGDFVRIGIGLLGVGVPAQSGLALEPAVTFVSEIVSTRELAVGDVVGYGCTLQVDRPTRAAIVPVGYYDGLPRSFGASGSLVVNGVACPVLGRINMDSTIVDVTGVDADVGSPALVFGRHDGHERPIEDVAEMAGTIPYEILAGIGPRVQRIFVEH